MEPFHFLDKLLKSELFKMRSSLQSDLPFDRLKKVLIKVAFADHIRFVKMLFFPIKLQ
jgi:hypothetical protein